MENMISKGLKLIKASQKSKKKTWDKLTLSSTYGETIDWVLYNKLMALGFKDRATFPGQPYAIQVGKVEIVFHQLSPKEWGYYQHGD